ncbi:MAG: tRNA (adenosine(37)-N6)-dimethylallyltransferase MiaA [Bacilli bacterium]
MIICIVGPTCSGKSSVAEELSIALKAKIVNFDAFQIFREMNIGTAKPTNEELNSGRYFLYNIRNVNEPYDVYKYQHDCREFLNNNLNENIILVGGTGLYLKAALYDYKFSKEDEMPKDYLSDKTNQELFDQLNQIDPSDASKIGVNNRKRLLRSLFIYNEHGVSKTELNDNGKNTLLYKDVIFIGLDIDREILYKNINYRVDEMMKNGLSEEVKFLFNKYGKNERALQAIGYKEFNNELSDNDRVELIKKNTRNYAKRQMTFFRHQFNNIHWFKSKKEAIEYGKEIGK